MQHVERSSSDSSSSAFSGFTFSSFSSSGSSCLVSTKLLSFNFSTSSVAAANFALRFSFSAFSCFCITSADCLLSSSSNLSASFLSISSSYILCLPTSSSFLFLLSSLFLSSSDGVLSVLRRLFLSPSGRSSRRGSLLSLQGQKHKVVRTCGCES